MATKAPAKPEAEGTPPPKGGSKKVLIIIVALVVLLVAAGGGLAVMLMSKKKHAEGEADAAHPAETDKPKVVLDKTKPPTFVPMEPFTVNLTPENGDHFLQAALVLKVADPKAGDELKVYMPEIRHRVNLILSSRRPSELASIEGREDLADEIMEETNDVLGYPPPPKRSTRRAVEPSGPVLAVLFNTFIVQ
jgi:flagellar protein FliL